MGIGGGATLHGNRLVLLAPWLVVAGFGCGVSPSRDHAPMVPGPAVARAALESVLGRWVEAGDRRSEVDGVRVELSDTRNAEGARPTSFEVLGTVRADWARGYVVRLTWPDKAEPETAAFVVAGVDPIWVMRKDDIELLMHWEHPMTPKDPAEGPSP